MIIGSSIQGPTIERTGHIITEATGIEPASPLGQTVFKTVRCANQLASNFTESEGADPSCPCGTLTFQISVFAVPPTLYSGSIRIEQMPKVLETLVLPLN